MEKVAVLEIWEKLAKLMDEMSKISSISVRENDNRLTSIGDLLYCCQSKVKKLASNPETEFLASSVMRKYFRMALPAFVIPVSDVLDGDTSKISEIKAIQKTLDDDPALAEWEKIVRDFKKATAGTGMDVQADISDLSAISDIVYDAITVASGEGCTRVYQLRKGQKSEAEPVLLDAIGKFDSIHSAVNLYELLPQQSFVGFFGLSQTYKQTDDKFSEWYRGEAAGRKRNMLHNWGADNRRTEDEYNSTTDTYAQGIYCVVRDGKDIRVFAMPINCSGYENKFRSFTNSFGYRSTYAPIQIFFENAPAPTDKQTNLPAMPDKKYWLLNEILDDEQKIWLPLFFLSVKKKFFDDNSVKSELALLPEETAIYMENSKTAIVPCSHEYVRYTIEEPKQFFSDKNRKVMNGCIAGDDERFNNAAELCEFFGITAKDISCAPFGAVGMSFLEQGINIINKQVGKAYYKIIAQRLIESWDKMAEKAHEWYAQRINDNLENIIDGALAGAYPFASIRIHKRPILNEDGTQKMVKKNEWSSALIPALEATDIAEGKSQRCLNKYDEELRYFYPATIIGKHPPVVVEINPQSVDDIIALCGCGLSELPPALRYVFSVRYFKDIAREISATWSTFSVQTTIRVVFGKREYINRIKKN